MWAKENETEIYIKITKYSNNTCRQTHLPDIAIGPACKVNDIFIFKKITLFKKIFYFSVLLALFIFSK